MDGNVIIILICIAVLVLMLISTIGLLIYYTGLLIDVQIDAGRPPLQLSQIYYRVGQGSYQDVGPMCNDAVSISPESTVFAVYYDDPTLVESKQRWAVGAMLPETSTSKGSQEAFKKFGYKPFTFPTVENVVKAKFPNSTPFSIAMGRYKVYPQISYYIKERRLCAHPWIEVYSGDTIHYMVPLSRQEEFYVPEVLESAASETSKSRDKSRKSKSKERKKMADGDNMAEDDVSGVVNMQSLPLVQEQHTYAALSKASTVTNHVTATKLAGEVISQTTAIKPATPKRSKNAHVQRGPKSTDIVPTPSASSLPQHKQNASHTDIPVAVINPVVLLKDCMKMEASSVTMKNCDVRRRIGDVSGEESAGNSSDVSSRGGSPSGSSFFSSEYSYTSEGTNTTLDDSFASRDTTR